MKCFAIFSILLSRVFEVMALFRSLTLFVILKIIACSTSEETCEKIDTCSCKFKNESKVNIWPEDGGSNPRFTDIPEAEKRTFKWNPCTPFSTDNGCKDVMSCQDTYQQDYPAGTKDSTFSVDSEGNVVITYGASSDGTHTRQTQITLICDPTKNGTKPASFTGKPSGSSTTLYTGTFSSKFACATGGSSSGLSVGSILLIIFFPLLLMYVVIGVLVNRFGRGIESMPELLPNYSFWADFPFLVKDGVVFTYDRIKTGICGKCGKGGYAEI